MNTEKGTAEDSAAPLCYLPYWILPLGARFRYDPRKYGEMNTQRVWVKLSVNLIAEWRDDQMGTNWVGQQTCSFSEIDGKSEDEVLVVG